MMDLTVYADVLPAAGETRFGESFTTGFGGKGANQAVMAARTGARVTMITGIGKDGFGENNFLLCYFPKTSVSLSFMLNGSRGPTTCITWLAIKLPHLQESSIENP